MKIVLLSLLFLGGLFAKDISIEDFQKLSSIKDRKIKVIEFKSLDSVYILRGLIPKRRGGERIIDFSVSKDLKYTFYGVTMLSQNSEMIHIKKPLTPYKDKVSLVYGSGEDEYYIFTDPQCPFCRKFERKLFSLDLEKKVKINYFLYPLDFHKSAIPMSRHILSQKDDEEKLEIMKNIMLENSDIFKTQSYTQEQLKIFENKINSVKVIAKDLGVQGTPTIFKPDGTKVNIDSFFKRYNEK